MVDAGKGQCHTAFDSFYNKSSLYLLYGGMRKRLFINKHPAGAISSKNVGLKVGKSFFDLNEQQLEYKEKDWRVKANFGGSNLFNLKKKIGEKQKGVQRNNIQFGTDESHFGSGNKDTKYSVGGMFNFNIAGISTATRLKVFSDECVEVFTDANVADVKIGCDMRVSPSGAHSGYIGASYGLPMAIAGLTNTHVGGILQVHTMQPCFGVFSDAALPVVQKATLGLEVFNEPRAALFGAELVVDEENSILAKAGDNGAAQFSWVRKFKGIELRMGINADLPKCAFGKFGARITLAQ